MSSLVSFVQSLRRRLFDRDYSPAYQDEYQRLWHEAAGERDELRPGFPVCPFCGGELCSVVLAEDVAGGPGVSCGGCGAYTSRLPWREPWIYEGRSS